MQNRIIKPVLGLVLGLFMLFAFAASPAMAAGKVPANLKVMTYKGKVLFDDVVKTGTTKIKPNASCLGGHTGPARTLKGPTATGILKDASLLAGSLRPLKISDGDFGFGLCGFGSTVAKGEGYWAFKFDYKSSSTGGDITRVKKGSTVLWYLTQKYDPAGLPLELFLKAPVSATKGSMVKVRVVGYDDKGRKSPVEGASFDGVSGEPLTDADGYSKIKITKKTRLRARATGLIPSNHVAIAIRK